MGPESIALGDSFSSIHVFYKPIRTASDTTGLSSMSEALLSPHLRELLNQLRENVEDLRECEHLVEITGSGANVPHLTYTHHVVSRARAPTSSTSTRHGD